MDALVWLPSPLEFLLLLIHQRNFGLFGSQLPGRRGQRQSLKRLKSVGLSLAFFYGWLAS
jgi:hypothetical protein